MRPSALQLLDQDNAGEPACPGQTGSPVQPDPEDLRIASGSIEPFRRLGKSTPVCAARARHRGGGSPRLMAVERPKTLRRAASQDIPHSARCNGNAPNYAGEEGNPMLTVFAASASAHVPTSIRGILARIIFSQYVTPRPRLGPPGSGSSRSVSERSRGLCKPAGVLGTDKRDAAELRAHCVPAVRDSLVPRPRSGIGHTCTGDVTSRQTQPKRNAPAANPRGRSENLEHETGFEPATSTLAIRFNPRETAHLSRESSARARQGRQREPRGLPMGSLSWARWAPGPARILIGYSEAAMSVIT